MEQFILIYIVQKVLTLPRGCNNGQILWRADAIIHSTCTVDLNSFLQNSTFQFMSMNNQKGILKFKSTRPL